MATIVRTSISRYDFPKLIDAMHITSGVEVGVEHGWFSHHLLSCSKLAELWSVDPWAGRKAHIFPDAASLLSEFGERSVIRRMPSVEAAESAVGKRFGFVYIDGDHLRESVEADIAAWLPLTTRPGIMAGHDYVEGVRKVDVIPVVNELAESLGLPVHLTREVWASWFFILGEG